MQTHVVPIKGNGDISLPEDVRRRLGEAGQDTVEVVVRDDGIVDLRRPQLTRDDVYGILPPLPNASVSFEDEIERAMAEHVARKLGRLPQ